MKPIIIHQVGAATWPQILTATIAGAAFVLSVVALLFQRATWKRAGFRPHAVIGMSIVVGPSESLYPEAMLHVTVRNTGRIAGDIDGPRFEAMTKLGPLRWRTSTSRITPLVYAIGEPAARIEGESSAEWHVDVQEIADSAHSLNAGSVRAVLALGSGRTIRTKVVDISSWGRQA